MPYIRANAINREGNEVMSSLRFKSNKKRVRVNRTLWNIELGDKTTIRRTRNPFR
jgi:hypothetical protein